MMHTEILEFWFQEITPNQWFKKDLDFDHLISQRFSAIHQQASHCELYSWRKSAKGRLAEIIVLDQFSRNIFRGTPLAFASDPLALALAQEAISQSADKELSAIEKNFLYMPFMHSESPLIHQVAVNLFENNQLENSLIYEIKHKEIIDQFGRYPHRNKILGRKSTPQELEFLTQANSSF